MKKKIFLTSILGAVLGIFSAFSSSSYAALDPKGTLIYCSEGSPVGFDPSRTLSGTDIEASSNVLFNKLVDFNRGTIDIIPALATSWEVSEDGKTWIFHLRKGVKFHSNSKFKPTRDMNADDVVASFDRMHNPENAFAKAWATTYPFYRSMGLDKIIDKISKIDDHTVQFTLNKKDAAFLSKIAIPANVIHSKEYMDQLMQDGRAQAINSEPIGTGPFSFVRYVPDNIIRYKANMQYWNEQEGPKVKSLVYSIIPDPTVRVQKLISNECHIINMPSPIFIEQLRQNSSIKFQSIPGFNVGYVHYNTEKIKDPRVRQALDMAIDKKSLIKSVYNNSAELVINPMAATQWSNNPDIQPYPYDISKAKELLAQAGYPDGFEMSLWTLPVSRPYNPNGRLMGEMIQADWRKIGVKVKLVTYEWGEYLKRGREGEHDSLMLGWTGVNGDPDDWLNTLFGCAAVGGGNLSRFCNQPFEELLQKGLEFLSQEQRAPFYKQAQQIWHDQLPSSPIATANVHIPMNKGVQGYKIGPVGGMRFYGVSYVKQD